MTTDFQEKARRLRNAVEPVAAGVYFAPEAHAAYEALGFEGSPVSPGRRRPPGAEVVLHQSRRVHGSGTGGGRRGRVRLLQPEGCRAGGRGRVADHQPGGHPRRPGSRARPRCCGGSSAISPRASVGSPTCSAAPPTRLRGQAARSTGGCARSASPATRWVTCGEPRTCCASTAATATSSPGRSAAPTRWRSCC